MSRRVFCSMKLLYEVLCNDTRNATNKYLKYLWHQPISFFIDDKYNLEDQEFYKLELNQFIVLKTLECYDDNQIEIGIDFSFILKSENIDKYCNDIFILNEDENECNKKIRETGFLVISEKNLSNLGNIFKEVDVDVNRRIQFTYPGDDLKLPGWHSAIETEAEKNQFKPIAVNSIIICDLFVLHKQSQQGIENLKSLINYLISNNPDAPINVTLFTMMYHPKTNVELISIGIAQNCMNSIKSFFPNIKFEIILHQEIDILHGRFLITNFFFGCDTRERGFNLFSGPKVVREKGKLVIKGAFQHLLSKSPKGPITEMNLLINECREIKNSIHKQIKEAKLKGLVRSDIWILHDESITDDKISYNRLLR